jgi:inward rectifier potassium channel
MTPSRRQKPPPALSAAGLRSIERRGIRRHGLRDLYHTMMTISLPALLGVLAVSFVFINIVFAIVYHALGGLGGVSEGRFSDAFFFSVETLSTTGYGAIYPVSMAANICSSVEILLGLLGTALATGILFARLSRPQARVLFSNVAVIREMRGVPTLMFRLVNERRNQIAEARISVTVTRDETDEDGSVLRRMHFLKLERDVSPVFALSWLIMHKITPDSPLYDMDAEEAGAAGHILICAFTGIDDTLNASIYVRHIYGAEDIRFGHRFVDVIDRKSNHELSLDYGRFHDTIPD